MIGWLKKKQGMPREHLLAARVVRNALVRESRVNGGGIRLTAPLRRTGLRKTLGVNSAPEKKFELDELGAFVWDAIDGRRTVEVLIRHFSGEKRVNLREAEVAVLAFLKTLTQRGLIALVVPQNTDSDSRDLKSA